jgi:hypothetical protein
LQKKEKTVMQNINDFMFCRDLKDGALFLFEEAEAKLLKGKNSESRPGGKFRQEFYRREIPFRFFFCKKEFHANK